MKKINYIEKRKNMQRISMHANTRIQCTYNNKDNTNAIENKIKKEKRSQGYNKRGRFLVHKRENIAKISAEFIGQTNDT